MVSIEAVLLVIGLAHVIFLIRDLLAFGGDGDDLEMFLWNAPLEVIIRTQLNILAAVACILLAVLLWSTNA